MPLLPGKLFPVKTFTVQAKSQVNSRQMDRYNQNIAKQLQAPIILGWKNLVKKRAHGRRLLFRCPGFACRFLNVFIYLEITAANQLLNSNQCRKLILRFRMRQCSSVSFFQRIQIPSSQTNPGRFRMCRRVSYAISNYKYFYTRNVVFFYYRTLSPRRFLHRNSKMIFRQLHLQNNHEKHELMFFLSFQQIKLFSQPHPGRQGK